MAIKSYLDYTGLKRVLTHLLPGARKIWHGTAEEWHNLSDEERNTYDQAEVIDRTLDEPILTAEYVRNQNILSSYEAVSLPFTAQYDGILTVACPTNAGVRILVNGVEIGCAVYVQDYSTSNSTTVAVNKGDVITFAGKVNISHARWYKLRDYTGR